MEGKASGWMVCIQSTSEVLVALAKEMAEGPMDCAADSLAWTPLLIDRKENRGESTFGSSPDSISDAMITA